MQYTDKVAPFIVEFESIINAQKKDFWETTYFLSKLVFCDSVDYDKIELLRYDTK